MVNIFPVMCNLVKTACMHNCNPTFQFIIGLLILQKWPTKSILREQHEPQALAIFSIHI